MTPLEQTPQAPTSLKRETPIITHDGKSSPRGPTLTAYGHTVTVNMRHSLPTVRLNAPSFFKDPDFLAWLNHPGTATWHVPGSEPNDCSDVWTVYAGSHWNGEEFIPEGPDTSDSGRPGIPDRIYALIGDAVAEALGDRNQEALVWITNLT